MEAAFIPEVIDELDTQNFENFEEVSFKLLRLVSSSQVVNPIYDKVPRYL